MCMQLNGIRPYQCWNWSGDMILHDTIIPASRKVPDTKISRYDIDIRDFVSIGGNSVIRKTLHQITDNWTNEDKLLFFVNGNNGFDFRAHRIFEWFSGLDYIKSKRHFDQWLFPEETLAQNGGDCEDLSFLLATLLIESGISQDCVRVALGRIIDHTHEHLKPHDHAWVMYQQELGAWQIFDPLEKVKQLEKSGKTGADTAISAQLHTKNDHPPIQDIEYIPCFVFNPEHLWRVRSTEAIAGKSLNDYLNNREFWANFDPSFAASVHNFILEQALKGMSSSDLVKVKLASLRVDINVLAYDPRDHFDFAYMQASWDQVEHRLKSGTLDDFGLAIHAISDFYAHSMYAYFAPKTSGKITPYSPGNSIPSAKLVYDFTGLPMPGANLDTTAAAKLWQGELISGQWWRWFTTYPSDLKNPKELQKHRNLPDHDALAIDSPTPKQQDNFFVRNGTYLEQFRLRQQAAIDHVAQVYQMWSKSQ